MKYTLNDLRKVGAIVMIGLTVYNASAQEDNLVPNGSFESTDGKVKKLGGIESATGWTSPTGARADLFSPNKLPDIDVPENIYGKETAKEGTNYAGIVGYSYGNKLPRTYIMTKLSTPLKKGMRYCVKFSISLAEASKYSCNNVGVNFSKKPFGTDQKVSIIETTSVAHAKNDREVIDQVYNWEQVCGTFVAEGGEKYITIGNFTADDKMHTVTNKKIKDSKVPIIIAAYYYIDDVSVELLEDKEVCNCIVPEEKNEYSTTIYQKSILVNDKMTPEQKVNVQQLFFAFGQTDITTEGNASLDLIVEQMKANPAMKLKIYGHSDEGEVKVSEEKPAFADMDKKRVNVVIAYLKEKGIAESRLVASPVGDQEPNDEISDSDDDDIKMAKNRRVTFEVVK